MTAIQCISRDGCIDAGYCQYCGRCLRPAVVTYSEPRCPHGYVISDTTHQCPKCGPVEVVSSNEQVGPLGWTLEMFVRDGLDRCRKMAATKIDEHRQGWLDDEWYWSEMLKRVQSETKAPQRYGWCVTGMYKVGHVGQFGPDEAEYVLAQKTSTEPGS